MAVQNLDFSPNFRDNQLLNVLLQILAGPPGAIQGKVILDSTAGAVKVSLDGTTWATLATMDDLGGAGVSQESVVDALGNTILTGSTNIGIVYDDAANAGDGSITFTLQGAIDADTLDSNTAANLLARANHTGSQASTTISDFTTAVNALAQAKVDAVIDAAPGTLDTLNELAAALQDNPDIITDILAAQALRPTVFVSTYGDGSATGFAVVHSLATVAPIVQIIEVATGAVWSVPWVVTDLNTVTITHTIVPTAGQFRAVVAGRAD